MDIIFNVTNLITFIAIILYTSYIILTIRTDKKNRSMSPTVLAYGVIISLIYIVYMCIAERETIYVNVIYLVIMTLLLLANILSAKKRAESNYVIDLLTMLLIMVIFTGEFTCILTIIGTLISIALYIFINKIKDSRCKGQKTKNTYNSNINITFIMGILNLLTFISLISITK